VPEICSQPLNKIDKKWHMSNGRFQSADNKSNGQKLLISKVTDFFGALEQ
jgi:hypothetical protein